MDLGETIEGRWWKPEDPEAVVAGSLAEEDDLFILKASGRLAGSNGEPFDELARFRMLHGVSERGEPITLLGCHCFHRRTNLGAGGGSERWRIESIVRGCLLEEPDERVNSVRVELDSALEWSGARPIEIETAGADSTTLTANNQTCGRASVSGALVTMEIEHRLEYQRSSASLRQAAVFVFDAHEGVDFRTAMKNLVFPVRDLIAFATGGYVEIRSVEGRPAAMSDGSQPSYCAYFTRLQRPQKQREARATHEMLTLARLGIAFDELIPRWFRLSETHRTTVSMLLVPSHAPYLYADSHLLTAWLALDAYHQSAVGGAAIDAELHEARVKAIVQAAPREHREWAKNVLSGKNQVGAKRRLQEVIERSGTTGQAVLAARQDFVSLAVSGRQQVAHPSVVDSEAGLRYLITASAIRQVLRHCLLVDLGVDSDAAGLLVVSNPVFAWCLEQLASL